jgi:hypothetical protein
MLSWLSNAKRSRDLNSTFSISWQLKNVDPDGELVQMARSVGISFGDGR